MREIVEFVQANDIYFLLGLSGLSLVLLVCTVALFAKLARLKQRRHAKLADGRVEDIIYCLTEHYDSIEKLKTELEGLETSQAEHRNLLEGCLQKVGVVKFDAFEDVGGEQSFVAALLDSSKNGIVLSSLYGRQESRLYAKGIVNGEGDRALSDEERRALDKALS